MPAFADAERRSAALGDAGRGRSVDGSRLAMTTDSFVVKPSAVPGRLDRRAGGQRHGQRPRGVRREAARADRLDDPRGGPRRRRAAGRGRRDRARPRAAAGVEIVAGDTKVVERGAADGMYMMHDRASARVDPRAKLSRRTGSGRATTCSCRARSASTGRRSCSPADEFDLDAEIESDTCSLWPAVDALLEAAGAAAALHARRDARRRRVGAQRARARVGGRGRRARGRRAGVAGRRSGAASSSGSTRCTWPTRAGSWRSWRPRPPTRRWRRCARCAGCEQAAAIGEVRPSRRGWCWWRRLRRQAGDGPARRRSAAADLLTKREETRMAATRVRTEAGGDRGGDSARPVDDDRPLLRGRLGCDDVRHQSEPRGHHPGRDPRDAPGRDPQPGDRVRGRRRVHPGLVRRRAGQARPVRAGRRGLDRQRADQRRGPLDRIRRRTRRTASRSR